MPKPNRSHVVLDTPWAILPSALAALAESARVDPAAAGFVLPQQEHSTPPPVGAVAVIPVYGVIEHRSDWMTEMFGGTSVDSLRDQMRAALSDSSVKAIVLDIDSPGGTVAGMTELAAEMRSARGGSKPIVAVANTMAASAAYWLAAQADEVIVTPSGSVGSVGVYAVHQEASRMLDEMGVTTTIVSAGEHKTEGNEYEPLTDEARSDIQERVDSHYQQFLSDVAAGRRTSVAEAEANYGGGRVLTSRKALDAGMVDRVETLAQTLTRMSSTGGRRRALAAEEEGPEMTAEAEPETIPAFTDRIAALAAEATDLTERATERARLRAKEGRPAFSTTTETSLRTIRSAIDSLLALDDPALPEGPDEPVLPVASTPPPAAPTPRRLSDEEWAAHLEDMVR